MRCGVSYGVLQGLRVLLARCVKYTVCSVSAIHACKEKSRPLPGSDLSEDQIRTSWRSCVISFLVLTKATMDGKL